MIGRVSTLLMRAVTRPVVRALSLAALASVSISALSVSTFSLTAMPAAAQSRASGRGTLYIVGGGPQTPEMVLEFVELAGGRGKAKIIVFAMASEEGLEGGNEKAADLRLLGADARNVWIDRAQAMTDSVARLLDGATGVWFGGGDQVRLANVLRGTPTERAIHARYASGAVIGGTSAGAAVMSRLMLTGDEARPGGARPDSTLAWGTIERENVLTAEGFGFITDAIVDQHFFRRKRYGRLMAAVIEHAPHLGVGIDESTALVVGPDGRWRVSGASGVVILDARKGVRRTDAVQLQATEMRTHVLTAGGVFDPETGVATPGRSPR